MNAAKTGIADQALKHLLAVRAGASMVTPSSANVPFAMRLA